MTSNDLKIKIQSLIRQVYTNKYKPSSYVEYDELTKFPQLKQTIINLLTLDYESFLSSIDWVAPRPTTFRINLKNDQSFYLIYNDNNWVAQIEGKKYFIKSLPEEEKAALAISTLLRYGSKIEKDDIENNDGGDLDIPEPEVED